jgi:glucose/arabinose dehydrogenase/azurin/lysophospholipase L1-like esterase
VDPDGTINPKRGESLSHPEALDSAAAIIMSLRFRHWDDATMRRFDAAMKRGVPIIALRTSTHAFNGFAKGSEWESWNFNATGGWGKRVLGETWVSHWGKHKIEATRGEIEPTATASPLLRGVKDVFGDSDVYEAYPPADAKILLRGIVLKGMNPTDAPADYSKRRASDKVEQPVNQPAMPVAWTRELTNSAGSVNRILCTTMGAATDLKNEGLRRLLANAVFWGLQLEVPATANVAPVDAYEPLMYGFDTFRRGIKAADHAVGQKLRAGDAPPAPKPAAKPSGAGPLLKLNSGDHIVLIGNAFPDRMQHHGWLETYIVAHHPQHDLTFRNLGFSGDEIGGFLNKPVAHLRQRSENFGSNDDWLKRVKADVVFALFGFNESFAGPAGLPKFREQLATFLQETATKNYNGKGAPRVVLFSPIATEESKDVHQPNNTAQRNADLKSYTEAMREVAKSNNVAFVDLFAPSLHFYAEAAAARRTLTFNTIHLTETGDQVLAREIFSTLFAQPIPAGDTVKLRAAINEKNKEWHARYRTVDGYNVYGGRSRLEFGAALANGQTPPESARGRSRRGPMDPEQDKISNYEILQEEMAQRDVKTANRDRRVWAVAKGGDLKVDDSNLPLVRRVPANRADVALYLDGQEAIKKMTVAKGCRVNLFADEKRFPELINPVQMAWDTKGRLWVAVWPSYPELTPTATVKDKLIILEDTNQDGVADKSTTFLDGLNCPTGFQFFKDGVLVVQAPDLWWVRDTNADDKPDSRERVLMGIDSADSHHTANSLVLDPGGATYLSDGVFHRAQTETPWGVVRNYDGAIFRYEPLTHKYERYAAYGFANPHGRVFDRWGNDIITDATGNNSYFGPAISGFIDFPAKHRECETFWPQPSRPCPGTGLISSRHFPEEWQGDWLDCNVIGMRGIFHVKVNEVGSGLRGESRPQHFLESSDENFRPSGVACAPDGSIYVLDWAQQLIGHMQHHIRDPNRDYTHGRIYRVTYEGRALVKPPKIYGEPVEKLLALLQSPENDTRTRAKVELGKHDAASVSAAAKQWLRNLDPKDPDFQHHVTEALWVHQWHNVVDEDLLQRVLRSPDYRARAAATRVLCYWRDRVVVPLKLLAEAAGDAHPRVRLEAVRAASFFRDAAATDVALTAMKFERDYYLDYVLTETLRQLKQFWQPAMEAGRQMAANNPAGLNRLLRDLNPAELQRVQGSDAVKVGLLTRRETSDSLRLSTLNDLAAARQTTAATVLLDTLAKLEPSDASRVTLARMLTQQPPAALQPELSRLNKLTTEGSPGVRQAAWAAMTYAKGSVQHTLVLTTTSVGALTDWLDGLPLLLDQELRKSAHSYVKSLVGDIPPAGRVSPPGGDAVGRVSPHGVNSVVTPPGEGVVGRVLPPGASPPREIAPPGAASDDASYIMAQLKPGSPYGNLIRAAAIRALVCIPVDEMGTFKMLAALIDRGELVPDAAVGLRMLPRSSWCKPEAAQAANGLVAWAKKIPAGERTSDDFIQAVQTADELAGLLPEAQAQAVRADLKQVRVAVYIIRTVREQMRYDTPRLVVAAGKPFELRIENPDFMPHNLVVIAPDQREAVGAIAEKMKPDALDKQGRAFVPDHPAILAATKLLDAGQKAVLQMRAPETEGVCEYVCTFPGHWQVMFGRLVVTKDVDAYLAKHPQAPAPVAAGPHAHRHSEYE